MNKRHPRPLGQALTEAGKAVGCVALTALLALVPMTCVAISSPCQAVARVARAKLDLTTLEKALRQYHERTGRLPGPVDRLDALVAEGLLREPLRDPWGNPYTYAAHDGAVEITSLGADGAPGGDEEDGDTVHHFRLKLDSKHERR